MFVMKKLFFLTTVMIALATLSAQATAEYGRPDGADEAKVENGPQIH